MSTYRFQFTIKQIMIAVAIVGLFLALVVQAMDGSDGATTAPGLIMGCAWPWASYGPALLFPPRVMLGLLVTSCLPLLPFMGHCVYRFATSDWPVAIGWLLLGLAALWLISPLVIGYMIAKDFHAWRSKNHQRQARSTAAD